MRIGALYCVLLSSALFFGSLLSCLISRVGGVKYLQVFSDDSYENINNNFFSLPWPNNCTGWGCRIQRGFLSSGAPYLRLRNVCIGQRKLLFIPDSSVEERILRERLQTCCGVRDLDTPLSSKMCGSLHCLGEPGIEHSGPLCQYNLGLYDMRMNVGNWSELQLAQPIDYLSGTSWWLDTAVCNWHQFKHTTAKFIQYAMLEHTFAHLVMNRVDHLPGDVPHLFDREGLHSRAIFNATILPDILSGMSQLHLGGSQPKAPPLCVTDIFSLVNYEQMHFSVAQGNSWRKLMHTKLNVPISKCPPPRVALLSRTGTDGTPRGIANPEVISQVAAEFGIKKIDRVTIGAKNSSAEHIALFSSFGLLFSGHSSQLTNLIFSQPNTAVVELVGSFLNNQSFSPFEVGMKEIGILYEVSRGHDVDITDCNSCETIDKNAVIILKQDLLRDSISQVLQRQAKNCPGMAW